MRLGEGHLGFRLYPACTSPLPPPPLGSLGPTLPLSTSVMWRTPQAIRQRATAQPSVPAPSSRQRWAAMLPTSRAGAARHRMSFRFRSTACSARDRGSMRGARLTCLQGGECGYLGGGGWGQLAWAGGRGTQGGARGRPGGAGGAQPSRRRLARVWGNSGGQQGLVQLAGRFQPPTWVPACPGHPPPSPATAAAARRPPAAAGAHAPQSWPLRRSALTGRPCSTAPPGPRHPESWTPAAARCAAATLG